jgi:O-antigen ligase
MWPLVVFLVFTIPWEKSLWVPAIGTFAHLAGLLAFAAGAVDAVRRREVRRPNAALLLAAVFVLWVGFTYFWSLDQTATAARISTFAKLLAMVWLIWDQCRGPARQAQLVSAYVCGAAFASALAFYRYFHDRQTYYLRYAAGGFDPNDFGLVVALAIPLALYLALRASGWARWCWLAVVPAFIAAVLLTASRAALVATFAALFFAVWAWPRANWAYRGATLIYAVGLVLSVVWFAPAPQRQRLSTIGTEITTGTLHNRTQIWKAGIRALEDHPIRGVGSGAYPKAVEPWLGRPPVKDAQYVAHNTFLSILVETGVVGAGICTLLLASLVFFAWSLASNERALWTVVAGVWALGVLTLTWEHYKPTWLIMALIMTDWARAAWTPPKAA